MPFYQEGHASGYIEDTEPVAVNLDALNGEMEIPDNTTRTTVEVFVFNPSSVSFKVQFEKVYDPDGPSEERYELDGLTTLPQNRSMERAARTVMTKGWVLRVYIDSVPATEADRPRWSASWSDYVETDGEKATIAVVQSHPEVE